MAAAIVALSAYFPSYDYTFEMPVAPLTVQKSEDCLGTSQIEESACNSWGIKASGELTVRGGRCRKERTGLCRIIDTDNSIKELFIRW